MKRATKAVIIAAALPLAALPLTLGGPLPTAAATGLIPDGPATVLHHGPTPTDMGDNLNGALCDAPKVCREVHYDWIQPLGLVEIGVQENVGALNSAIKNVGTDPKIVYGFSGGARVASVWLRDRAKGVTAPESDDLSFVFIGNGGRKYGGVNGWWYGNLLSTPTKIQYEIVDIAREYDPVADFPRNPFNLLALANSIAAFQYVHLRYDEADLDDPDNIVWKEGKTTYVFVPTEHLPLLQGFYDFGLGSLVEDMEPALTARIDKAYHRTWLKGKESQGQASTLSPANEVSRSALRAFSAADSDEDEGGAQSPGAPDDKSTSGTGAGAAGEAEDAPQDSSSDVTKDSVDAAEPTVPVPAAGEVTGSEATGDTDEAFSTDAAGGQTGEDGDASAATAAHAAHIGGKHRAPLNGTRKIKRTKKAEAAETSVSGDVDAGADTSNSSNSATSPSDSDSGS